MVFYSLLEGTIIIIILLKVLHSQFFLRRMVNSLSVEYFDFHIKSMIHLICSNFTYKLTNIHTQRDKVRGRDSILHVAGTCSPSSGHSLSPSLSLSPFLSGPVPCVISVQRNWIRLLLPAALQHCHFRCCQTHTHTCIHTNALVHATLSKSFGSGFCVINWRFKFAQISHNSILQLFQFDIFCFY